MGAQLFHAEGGTDLTKLIVAFSILQTRQKKKSYTWQEVNGLESLDGPR